MHRRDFIKVVAGLAVMWPLAGRAQKAATQATIGLLGSGTAAVIE
jgi:hypothetical protein